MPDIFASACPGALNNELKRGTYFEPAGLLFNFLLHFYWFIFIFSLHTLFFLFVADVNSFLMIAFELRDNKIAQDYDLCKILIHPTTYFCSLPRELQLHVLSLVCGERVTDLDSVINWESKNKRNAAISLDTSSKRPANSCLLQ